MSTANLFTERTCHFSPCRRYRYELRIRWDQALPLLNFIGLNPSTADENQDDPTIRRCKGFAGSLMYGGLIMTNLFAYRATDPNEMMGFDGDQVGPENDAALLQAWYDADMTICAWGKNGRHQGRDAAIGKSPMGIALHCLRLNGDGSPAHPLYLPAKLTPIPFNY